MATAHLATATRDTAEYLRMLRNSVKQLIEQGGGLDAVSKVDQSKLSYLKVYKELKGRNTHQVYQELEWE